MSEALPPEDNVPTPPAGITPPPVARPPAASTTPLTTSGAAKAVTDQMADMVNNPSLPSGTAVIPIEQKVNQDELLGDMVRTPTHQMDGTILAHVDPVQAATATADSMGKQDVIAGKQEALANATYDATKIGAENTPQAIAAQGTVSKQSTVKGQLEELMQGDVKEAAWAKGSVIAAEEAMAARGLGASSIAGAAITQAIMDAGIKVADADAKTYANMDLTNLNNRQQTVIENTKMRHQTMLSDQAMDNAAKQFNAQNSAQVAQFFAGLMVEVDKFNVGQANSMKQFNASEINKTGMANLEAAVAINSKNADLAAKRGEFNTDQNNKMDQFYKNNQLIIDQANSSWRREVNTNNTAAENAANQFNATNLLGISTTAMTNIWQASRDEADWINKASENEMDRRHNTAVAAINRSTQFDMMSVDSKNSMFEMLGGFGLDLISSRTK